MIFQRVLTVMQGEFRNLSRFLRPYWECVSQQHRQKREYSKTTNFSMKTDYFSMMDKMNTWDLKQ